MAEKHLFALYLSKQLSAFHALAVGKQLVIQDSDLWHRVANVLHLQADEELELFDGVSCVLIRLSPATFTKKTSVVGQILAISKTEPLLPAIHLYQGILKKDAFEEVLYIAAQMGVHSITPLQTKKVHRSWGDLKELERAQKIMVAACEQAKQYCLPVINKPIKLAELKNNVLGTIFYTDPMGHTFFELLKKVSQNTQQEIQVIIGPEGGFTQEEEHMLKQMGIACYALTQSILRSQEAVTVTLGALRSVTR